MNVLESCSGVITGVKPVCAWDRAGGDRGRAGARRGGQPPGPAHLEGRGGGIYVPEEGDSLSGAAKATLKPH